MTAWTSDNKFSTAKWIVNSVANGGFGQGATHTTIASALTSASSGETIFIKPGTYTENLTLKAGVNLAAYAGDAYNPNVTIIGKCTFTGAGTVSISGIRLQTNSDFALSVTGSSASIVYLLGCYINCSNNTGIQFTSSSSSAQINMYQCNGDIGTTGITLFSSSSAGRLEIDYGFYTNTGSSSTLSTFSAGALSLRFITLQNGINVSGTASLFASNSIINTSGTSAISVTFSSSNGNSAVSFMNLNSGSNTAVSIGSGAVLNIEWCHINSTATNSITGAGTAVVTPNSFIHVMNVNSLLTAMPFGPLLAFGDDAIQLLEGSGSPQGVVTAPKGSLYLRTDGTNTTSRAYINTNSATNWTAIVTNT